MAVVQGVSLTPGFTMPRQSNEFYYLCGLETPHSYLLLDGRSRKATLLVPGYGVMRTGNWLNSADGR